MRDRAFSVDGTARYLLILSSLGALRSTRRSPDRYATDDIRQCGHFRRIGWVAGDRPNRKRAIEFTHKCYLRGRSCASCFALPMPLERALPWTIDAPVRKKTEDREASEGANTLEPMAMVRHDRSPATRRYRTRDLDSRVATRFFTRRVCSEFSELLSVSRRRADPG